MRRGRPTFVYLIEAEIGLVKIGYSHLPHTRLRTIAATSICPVRLVAQWPGASIDEKALHRRFETYRQHGEWFKNEGALAAFVLQAWGRGVGSVPSWPDRSSEALEQRKRELAARRSEAHRRNWADPAFRSAQEAARLIRERRAA